MLPNADTLDHNRSYIRQTQSKLVVVGWMGLREIRLGDHEVQICISNCVMFTAIWSCYTPGYTWNFSSSYIVSRCGAPSSITYNFSAA